MDLKLKFFNLTSKVFWGLLSAVVLLPFPTFSQEAIEPLPKLTPSMVHTIDGASYCSTGFGFQEMAFSFDGETVYSEESTRNRIPDINLNNSPYLRIGCSMNKVYLDYLFYEDSIRFDSDFEVDGSTYNSVYFKYNTILMGYDFTLILHQLHLDLGIGYTQVQYTLGLYDENSNIEGDDFNRAGWSYVINLKWFLSVFFYINWLNQQFIGDIPIEYSSQIGLNFMVKL